MRHFQNYCCLNFILNLKRPIFFKMIHAQKRPILTQKRPILPQKRQIIFFGLHVRPCSRQIAPWFSPFSPFCGRVLVFFRFFLTCDIFGIIQVPDPPKSQILDLRRNDARFRTSLYWTSFFFYKGKNLSRKISDFYPLPPLAMPDPGFPSFRPFLGTKM